MPVKAVILWAGCGRRIRKDYPNLHKAMIPLNGKPLLAYILQNIEGIGIKQIIPILGYMQDQMLDAVRHYAPFAEVAPIYNPDYERTNNLASLLCASRLLSGEDFIVINGDMVFDRHILSDMAACAGNAIATDMNSYPSQLDSPRVAICDGHITDVGRHLTIREADGYAVGIYRFSAESSEDYFHIGESIVSGNPNAGYHEPIIQLCRTALFKPVSTRQYRWMDVDESSDVAKAEALLKTLT